MKTSSIQGLLDSLNEFMPFSVAEKWDNVGLMIGNPKADVAGVLIGLDPCLSLLEEALSLPVNTVVTHHPLLFHPVKSIDLSTVQGKLISFAIKHDLNIIGCHTNFDQVAGGVSDLLARQIGIDEGMPLTTNQCDNDCGFGWLGELASPLAGDEFLQMVADKLKQPNLLVAGTVPAKIFRVAVCGGGCSDLAELAMGKGADVFITSEVKHSQARWAEDAGMCLLDAGHFSTENVALVGLQEYLADAMDDQDIHVSQIQDRPLRGYLEKA